MKQQAKWTVSTLLCGIMLSTITLPAMAKVLDLEAQREIYEQAQRWLDNRDVKRFKQVRSQIADYPLTPYLDYRSFLIDLGNKPPIVVRNFINSHREFPFANRISAPYFDALARQGKWSEMLQFSPSEPNGETYRCHFYHAKLKTGRYQEAFEGAKLLWQSGTSVSSACDPLFQVWRQQGGMTEELILQRMLLAFESRNRSLMRYLASLLQGKPSHVTATRMLALYDRPERLTSFIEQNRSQVFLYRQVELALEKIARADALQAQAIWSVLDKQWDWSPSLRMRTGEYIALRMMSIDSLELQEWRDSIIATSDNTHLIETRLRLALRNMDWQGINRWVHQLPEEERASIRWQYWLARSELQAGQTEQGLTRMQSLLGVRNFYSVAAAEFLQQSIQYPISTLTLNRELLKPYKTALIRIGELLETNKIAAAKSEWNWLLNRVELPAKEMLAAFAASQDWHHLTVQATIAANLWDNSELRFPLAHVHLFNLYGEQHGIDSVTLMALARQESAMDIEARSPVGARGIMQIMPATARYTAQKYQLSYQGPQQLYHVGKNIEIGSFYLKDLLDRYDNNRIFAFAAYNAGPSRVARWREQTQGELDAYAFIEAIPFRETRGYIQNVLMFETYYRELKGQYGPFLTANELATRY